MDHMVKAIMLVDKKSHGVRVHKGDIVKITLNGVGDARLVRNPNVSLRPDEFEMYILESEYAKFLN